MLIVRLGMRNMFMVVALLVKLSWISKTVRCLFDKESLGEGARLYRGKNEPTRNE